MYCSKCGTKFDGNFCPNCGNSKTHTQNPVQPVQSNPVSFALPTVQPQMQMPVQQPEKPKKRKKKRVNIALIILIILLILLLAAGGTIGFFMLKKQFDPSNKVIEALSAGNFEEAIELYEDLDETSDTLISGLKERLDTVYENYKSGAIDYDTAKLELDTIEKMDISDVAKKLDDTYTNVNKLNKSKTAFETAKAFEANGDYVNTITQYKLVIEEDTNYEAAKSGIASATDAYRKSVLQSAASSAADKDYAAAIKTLKEALKVLTNDSEITKQITVYTASCETETLNKAQSLLENKKYDEAEALLSDVLKILPNNSKLTELLNSIDGLRPVELNTVVVIDSYNYSYNDELFTDSYGNNYDGWYKYNPYHDNVGYAIHNLNKQYNKLDFSLVASTSMASSRKITLTVYLDDKLVYTFNDFTKTTAKQDISIDVSNATKLEIQIDDDAYERGNGSLVGIVDAVLSK